MFEGKEQEESKKKIDMLRHALKINNETGFKGLFNPNSTWRLFAEDKCLAVRSNFSKSFKSFRMLHQKGQTEVKISC